METTKLKKFAQHARRSLMDQVSAKLKLILADGSPARRENESAVAHLEKEIARTSTAQVIERVAYTWFNRFCALRFMDLNRYTGIGVVSPANGQTQPEILAEAKMGHIDESMVPEKTRQRVFGLLGGNLSSRDPQGEAYRLLLVSACNAWYRSMPFLFQRIADFTELLLPDDLLSDNSTLAHVREAMTPEHCQDVEVIGWLYQFYISEKKDEVFDGLKKNKKITPENIPAATQLFTPHWIVRYLVENSLGRLWMLNRPNSKLIERMEYYIKPEQPETDFLRISSPEEIRICDPACGSGHMLVYAFDLLYAIYEEEGYEPKDIPAKILKHNLFGIEIDERAGELAAFALTMKARNYDKRFLSRATSSGNPILPNICVLENVQFQGDELKKYMDHMGRDLFTPKLITTLNQFEEADNFGSLIRPEATDVGAVLGKLKNKDTSRDAFLHLTHEKLLRALRQADYLSPKYHVVVANPPYMGGKGMNARLGAWAKDNYLDSKSDLFAMFIERGLKFLPNYGYSAMVTMQSWMFLSSYESMRIKLLSQTSIESMVHMANMVMGIAFGTSATIWKNKGKFETNGAYCYIEYEDIDCKNNKPIMFPPHNIRNKNAMDNGWLYRASAMDFQHIQGRPISYSLSQNAKKIFSKAQLLSDEAEPRQGLISGDTDRFLRIWHEISYCRIGIKMSSRQEAKESNLKWFPIDKGGEFRKWYGNNDYIVNWENDGDEIRGFTDNAGKLRSRPQNMKYYFRPGATWTKVTSGHFSVRLTEKGHIFSDAGMKAFATSQDKLKNLLGFLNSKLTPFFLAALSETINYEQGNISRLPILNSRTNVVDQLFKFAQIDWDAYEVSLGFNILPILKPDNRQQTIKDVLVKSHLQSSRHSPAIIPTRALKSASGVS